MASEADVDLNLHELLALRYHHQWIWYWATHHGMADEEGYQWEQWFEYPEETHHIATVDCGWYTLYVFSAGTGDDGGASTIYAWFDNCLYMVDREAMFKAMYPDHIVFDFDTMFSTIYDQDQGGFQWQSQESSTSDSPT